MISKHKTKPRNLSPGITTNMLFNFFAITRKRNSTHTSRKLVLDCPKILSGLSKNSLKNLVRTVRKPSRKFSSDCPKTVPKIMSGLSKSSPENSARTVRKQCRKFPILSVGLQVEYPIWLEHKCSGIYNFLSLNPPRITCVS